MIKQKHLRWIELDSDLVGLAESMVRLILKQKGLRGRSVVYLDPREREKHAWEDNMTGMIAQLAATKVVTGDIDVFVDQQLQAGRDGTDYGIDIPPNIDVKSGRMNKKRTNTNPLSQDLLVNPKEFHDNWIYLHVQVHELTQDFARVCVVGWCESKDIEGRLSKKSNVPEGCWGLPAYRLNPVDLLCQQWEEAKSE